MKKLLAFLVVALLLLAGQTTFMLTGGTVLAQKGGGVAAQGEAEPIGPVGFTATPILQTSTTFGGQPIVFPQSNNQFVAVLAEVAPGGQSCWHYHPNSLIVYFLEGQLTIEMEGYGTHTFYAGDSLAEVVNVWHNGRNLGDTPARFLIVFATQEGVTNLVRPE